MSMPANVRGAESQNGARIPKLGYRKALSPEEAERFNDQLRESASRASQISRQPSVSSTVRSTPASLAPTITTRKKNSLLGGLFVKEPTLTALASFEADVKAKYGAATPQAVPLVSARKIPDYVPKVNSKWDGVPETVKIREREEKTRRRLSQLSNVNSPTTPQYDNFDEMSRDFVHSRSANSYAGSENASQGDFLKPVRCGSEHSTQSQDSHGNPASSTKSQSLRSPSGTSLPEITSFFPHKDITQVHVVPVRGTDSVVSIRTNSSTQSSTQSRNECSTPAFRGSSVEAIPEYNSSLIITPHDTSQITPEETPERSDSRPEYLLPSDKSKSVDCRRTAGIKPVAMDAFLAGEAKPLNLEDADDSATNGASDLPYRQYQQVPVEHVATQVAKKPASSRDRFGLRASMLVRKEDITWAARDQEGSAESQSSRGGKPRMPKGLAIFK